MLATSVIVVSVNWERYNKCTYPLHVWIVVDYAVVFLFRVSMFINHGLALGMGPEAAEEDRILRFKGRIVVMSCLTFVVYPFLWAWTIVGSLWFTDANTCLPEEGQKWGFLIWLIFSYCGLICVACISAGKWLLRRETRVNLVSPRVSELEILFESVRVPDWAFPSMIPGQDNAPRQGGHDFISYHPGAYMTSAQREEIEKLIQDLPTFRLKGVPTESSACPICLDEFEVGTEVRGLPCAHNFHTTCIDEWLRLNVKCPHCRCSVFPELNLSLGNDHVPTDRRDNNTTQISPTANSSIQMDGETPSNNVESLAITVDRLPIEHPT
ncbi:unnamed protein product [Calypogeia fissa]